MVTLQGYVNYHKPISLTVVHFIIHLFYLPQEIHILLRGKKKSVEGFIHKCNVS